jgi:hypothetical protein
MLQPHARSRYSGSSVTSAAVFASAAVTARLHAFE